MNKFRELVKKKKVKSLILSAIIFMMLIMLLKIGLVIRATPDLDVDDLKYGVGQNSKILDASGRVIGQSVGSEFRSSISIDELPTYVPEAFISIEDKRFYSHIGIDFKGLIAATVDNIKAGKLVRGASTITQQLIKNTHLSNERTLDRKIKEAYLSIKLENNMSKNEILEAYLNNTFFGQGAYGIEAASNIYFSKSASDLKLEEAAILAAIIQSPDRYAPYKRVNKGDVDYNKDTVIGEVVVGGNRFTCIYSDAFEQRRDLVLKEMYKQGKIDEESYNKAVNTPSVSLIKPSEKTMSDQIYYLSDFIKREAVEKLMDINGYSYEKASYLLDVSGYTIKTSIDMNIQHEINQIYNNRNNIKQLLKSLDYTIDPSNKNMLNSKGNIMYYDKKNIVDNKGWFYFNEDEFNVIDGSLEITSNKIEAGNNSIFYKDYYRFSEEGDLYIHNIDKTSFPEGMLTIKDVNSVVIKKDYLDNNPDFFLNDGKTLKINNKYYETDRFGKRQPDVSSVITDPGKGLILGMYGGSNPYNGYASNKIYNHKFAPLRLIRPFSIYYPKNAESDNPIKKESLKNGNQFSSDSYKELTQNNNNNILESLKLFDIINENPNRDSFVSKEESAIYNDETMDALAYGRFTHGMSLYDLAKPYTLLSSSGDQELTSILEIVDNTGKVIYSHSDRSRKEFNNKARFLTKTLIANNDYNYKNHQMLTANRESLTIYGSEDIVILSMISNNESKLRFKENLSTNIINSLIEKTFKEQLNSNKFKSPDDVFEYTICIESDKIANDTCISNGETKTVYSNVELEGMCDLDHTPVIEDAEDKDDDTNLVDNPVEESNEDELDAGNTDTPLNSDNEKPEAEEKPEEDKKDNNQNVEYTDQENEAVENDNLEDVDLDNNDLEDDKDDNFEILENDKSVETDKDN